MDTNGSKGTEETAAGEIDEPDFQEVLQLELAKLHKEYRMVEYKRHGFALTDSSMRTRANKHMPMLERDRLELHHEIRNATCRQHKQKSATLARSMKEALQTYDKYRESIQRKLKQILEIERHVDRITDKVVKQKFKMLALHGLSRTLAQRETDLRNAENHLYHFTCVLNTQLHKNKCIREEVMDLLMERNQFFNMHNLLKKQIARARTKMLSIVQLAIRKYDSRDEAMSKVKALRERETKESKLHGMEVQEYERALHYNRETLGFIKVKVRQRAVFEEAGDRRMRLGSAKEKELDTILARYRKSFRRILEYCSTKSLTDLVDSYKELDIENYNDFKYITNLNSECEVLREAVEILKSKIEAAHAEVDLCERAQRAKRKQLHESITAKEELLTAMRKQARENKWKIRDMTEVLGACFVLAKCDATPIMRLLGNTTGITSRNIRICLEQLDFQITDMKTEKDRLHSKQSNVTSYKTPVLGKAKVQSSGGPFYPSIAVGGMFNVDAMEDDDAKVLDMEPYFFEDMREYVYYKMVEEKLIDPFQRSISTVQLPSGDPSLISVKGGRINRLMQKIQNLPREKRKRKKAEDGSDEEEEMSQSTSVEDQHKRVYRRRTTIMNMGKHVRSLFAKSFVGVNRTGTSGPPNPEGGQSFEDEYDDNDEIGEIETVTFDLDLEDEDENLVALDNLHNESTQTSQSNGDQEG